MDKFDKIILSEIAENYKQPLSKIGKRIRRSPQFVKYRLDHLERKSIKFLPLILDFSNLGSYEVTALIKFNIIDPITEKIFLDYLFKMTESYKVLYTNGNYNILCSFILNSLEKVEKIKEELIAIADIEIKFLVNHSSDLFALNYLSEKSSEKLIHLSYTKNKQINDESIEIIREFQRTPLNSALKISKKLNLSYAKVKYAQDNSKIILGNTLMISDSNVNRAVILLKVKENKLFKSYSRINKNIVEANYLIGDFNAYIIVEDILNINPLIKIIIYELKDSISDYIVLDVFQIYKYGWYGL